MLGHARFDHVASMRLLITITCIVGYVLLTNYLSTLHR